VRFAIVVFSPNVWTSVRVPNDGVVPYSNHAPNGLPPTLIFPFKVAELNVIADASPVVTVTVVSAGASEVVKVLIPPSGKFWFGKSIPLLAEEGRLRGQSRSREATFCPRRRARSASAIARSRKTRSASAIARSRNSGQFGAIFTFAGLTTPSAP